MTLHVRWSVAILAQVAALLNVTFKQRQLRKILSCPCPIVFRNHTHTADFRAQQIQPNPHDIAVDGPDEAQHSPISKTGSPVGGHIGDGFTGAGVPASLGASLEVLYREQFALLANSIADVQRQLSDLTEVTNRTTLWMCSQQACSGSSGCRVVSPRPQPSLCSKSGLNRTHS